MEEEKKDIKEESKEELNEERSNAPILRQVIIETDGNMVRLIKNETAGQLELSAILRTVLGYLER